MNNEYLRKRFRTTERETPPLIGTLTRRNVITRNVVAEIFNEFGFTIGAEIGVYRGEYSQVLLDKNPNLKLYLVDPWFTVEFGDYSNKEKQRRNFSLTRQNLVGRNVEYIVKSSHDALTNIPDASLDFVYIDGSHYFDDVMFDLIEWTKKVRVGGIVSGHDYFHHHNFGVVIAVDMYTRAHGINEVFVTQEYAPSYLWVKS